MIRQRFVVVIDLEKDPVAVRIERARLARRHVHRIPPPTFVTIAKRPSGSERDGRNQSQIYEKRKIIIFDDGLDLSPIASDKAK